MTSTICLLRRIERDSPLSRRTNGRAAVEHGDPAPGYDAYAPVNTHKYECASESLAARTPITWALGFEHDAWSLRGAALAGPSEERRLRSANKPIATPNARILIGRRLTAFWETRRHEVFAVLARRNVEACSEGSFVFLTDRAEPRLPSDSV